MNHFFPRVLLLKLLEENPFNDNFTEHLVSEALLYKSLCALNVNTSFLFFER